jgi:hypothetical protein
VQCLRFLFHGALRLALQLLRAIAITSPTFFGTRTSTPAWREPTPWALIGPINWYGSISNFKLLFDRLVSMNGCNPRPDLIGKKSTVLAQALELECYFEDLIPNKVDNSCNPKLKAALEANVALRVEAERLIAAYVAPESGRAAIINELIMLFDGPQQREAERLAHEALAENQGAAQGPG